MNPDFEYLNKLWSRAPALGITDAAGALQKARLASVKTQRAVMRQIMSLLLVPVVGTLVVCFIPFRYILTYLSVICMMVTVMAFIAARIHQLVMLKKVDFTLPPTEVLPRVSQLYRSQYWLLSKGVIIYIVLLNMAFAGYFYETLWMTPLAWWAKIAVLIVYTAWFIFSVFIIGPRQKAKELGRTKDMLKLLKENSKNGL